MRRVHTCRSPRTGGTRVPRRLKPAPRGAGFILLRASARLGIVILAVQAAAGQTAPTGRMLFRGQLLPYTVIDGRAIYDGDIDLGPEEGAEAEAVESAAPRPHSVYINGSQ